MIVSSIIAISLTNAYQLFDIILMFGAGTGSIFILRWFWWRINAWSEIAAMLSSGIISIALTNESIFNVLFNDNMLQAYMKFPFIVLVTTSIWLIVTFVTPSDDTDTLVKFYNKTKPGGPGWNIIKNNSGISNEKEVWIVPLGIICMLIGCISIYSALFSTGYFIYGEINSGLIFLLITIISGYLLFKYSRKIML